MKKYLILIMMVVCFLGISCKEKGYTPKKPEEIENFQRVNGTHLLECEDVSPYIVIKNKLLNQDLLYSMTLYMNFEKGNRTNRLYKYYQFDYYLANGEFLCDYHIFDNIDGALRKYGQNFMPYYDLKSIVDKIMLRVKYSYEIFDEDANEGIAYDKEFSLSEDILFFDNKKDYSDTNPFEIYMTKESNSDENYERYKVNASIPSAKTGHIDMQIFVKGNDGNVYPYLGLYHYEFKSGNYISVSDEKIDKKQGIVAAYCQINMYETNGNTTTNTYFTSIDIK